MTEVVCMSLITDDPATPELIDVVDNLALRKTCDRD